MDMELLYPTGFPLLGEHRCVMTMMAMTMVYYCLSTRTPLLNTHTFTPVERELNTPHTGHARPHCLISSPLSHLITTASSQHHCLFSSSLSLLNITASSHHHCPISSSLPLLNIIVSSQHRCPFSTSLSHLSIAVSHRYGLYMHVLIVSSHHHCLFSSSLSLLNITASSQHHCLFSASLPLLNIIVSCHHRCLPQVRALHARPHEEGDELHRRRGAALAGGRASRGAGLPSRVQPVPLIVKLP
jgi:hypothetical protein